MITAGNGFSALFLQPSLSKIDSFFSSAAFLLHFRLWFRTNDYKYCFVASARQKSAIINKFRNQNEAKPTKSAKLAQSTAPNGTMPNQMVWYIVTVCDHRSKCLQTPKIKISYPFQVSNKPVGWGSNLPTRCPLLRECQLTN